MSFEGWEQYGIAAGTALGVWFVGWLFTRFLLPTISRAVVHTDTDVDDIAIEAVSPHVPLWFLGVGIAIAARNLDLTDEWRRNIDLLVRGGIILSITLAIASFLSKTIQRRALPFLAAIPSTGLIQGSVQLLVVAMGILIVLSNMGISITPLITALGVGSLAVALALQPTLTNLFAGFYTTLAGQIRVGDYIELESGQKGFVEDIGWRTTTIREISNNLVIMPNAKLSEMVLINFSLPQNELSLVIQVGVAYDSDLTHVERVTIECAKEVQKEMDGALTEHDPFIRYHTFGDSSINFSVILRIHKFDDRFLVTHEFHKRLHKVYEQEGIEIPFPQHVLHMAPGAEGSDKSPVAPVS